MDVQGSITRTTEQQLLVAVSLHIKVRLYQAELLIGTGVLCWWTPLNVVTFDRSTAGKLSFKH